MARSLHSIVSNRPDRENPLRTIGDSRVEEVVLDLRLGTFNVWGLPKPFADDLSARTRAIARRLPSLDLDVLLLQEVWTDEVRDTLEHAALDAGFEVALASRESGGGLMVISRLPILGNRFDKYHFRGDPERFSQGEFLGAKGYQTLILQGTEGPFGLINTHLHARYRKSRPTLNSAVRTAQLLQLVGETQRIPGSLIIGGDFNCCADDPEYRIFRGLTGSIDVAAGRRDLPTISRSNYYKRMRRGADKRIDYLFHRPGRGIAVDHGPARHLFADSETIRGIDRSLSDHYGVAARIGWRPLTTQPAVASPPPRDPEAFDLARRLLDVGRQEADRREETHLRYATGWVAAAVVAANLRHDPVVDRRRFLKGAIGALGFASLAPAVGYTTLARVDSDSKRDAFDDAQAVLARLEANRDQTV
jgi:endonuclease/exonuclease/phosphatase family metal-dependent hydrolase